MQVWIAFIIVRRNTDSLYEMERKYRMAKIDKKLKKLLLVIVTLVLLVLLLAPIGELQIPSFLVFKHSDKVAHFGLFFITGLASIIGAEFLKLLRTRILFGAVFGLFLAISTEFGQSLIPTRNISPYDLFADLIGLALAMSLCIVFYRGFPLNRLVRVQVKNGSN